jgi:cytochrome c oxidase assembly protein subunit 15
MEAPALAQVHRSGAMSIAPERRLRERLAALAGHLLIALVALVGIGGATRVMEAGLACPDWPLCYGSFLPGRQMNLQVFLEWFHRLDAFVVGVAVLVLAAASWIHRSRLPRWLPPLAGATLLLVAGQGALGALTVTQLLPFGVVTAHLATALVLVALVSGCHQGLKASASIAVVPADGSSGLPLWWAWATPLVALAVFGQCLLGGLMASQWAAGRCFSSGSGCGWLYAHRLVATPTAVAVLALAALAWWRVRAERPLASLAALLVLTQIGLGIASLRLSLAVPAVTVAHQLTAALLVAVLSALTARSWLGRSEQTPLSLELARG